MCTPIEQRIGALKIANMIVGKFLKLQDVIKSGFMFKNLLRSFAKCEHWLNSGLKLKKLPIWYLANF
jgi:hypothetical protein